MNVDNFLEENPGISREQIEKAEVLENPEPLGEVKLFDANVNDCGLVHVGDDGGFYVMRATTRTCVTVFHVRNGLYDGHLSINMNANDTIRFLKNNDGQNYDGYRCCSDVS